jgi:hypothetical protein
MEMLVRSLLRPDIFFDCFQASTSTGADEIAGRPQCRTQALELRVVPAKQPGRVRFQRIGEICQTLCGRKLEEKVDMVHLPAKLDEMTAARLASRLRDEANAVDHHPGQDRATALHDQNHMIGQTEDAVICLRKFLNIHARTINVFETCLQPGPLASSSIRPRHRPR